MRRRCFRWPAVGCAGEQKIAAARRAVNGPIRGAVYRLLSGTALLIGLLQAPGTVLDVYPDSRELAHVVSVQIKVITLDLYGTVASLVGADAPTLEPLPRPESVPLPEPTSHPESMPLASQGPGTTDQTNGFAEPGRADTHALPGFSPPGPDNSGQVDTFQNPTVDDDAVAFYSTSSAEDDDGASIIKSQREADKQGPEPGSTPSASPGT